VSLGGGLHGPNSMSGRPGSPGSGLVHWVSMMADHNHTPQPAHSGPAHASDGGVHYCKSVTFMSKQLVLSNFQRLGYMLHLLSVIHMC